MLWVDHREPTEALDFAWEHLRNRIASQAIQWRGHLEGGSGRAPAVARAAMGAYCNDAREDKKQLLSFFASWDEAIEACATVIEKDWGLPAETLPRSDDDD